MPFLGSVGGTSPPSLTMPQPLLCLPTTPEAPLDPCQRLGLGARGGGRHPHHRRSAPRADRGHAGQGGPIPHAPAAPSMCGLQAHRAEVWYSPGIAASLGPVEPAGRRSGRGLLHACQKGHGGSVAGDVHAMSHFRLHPNHKRQGLRSPPHLTTQRPSLSEAGRLCSAVHAGEAGSRAGEGKRGAQRE